MPADHPLRPIREMLNTALKAMDGTLAQIYAHNGRESIPPERLLRALTLQVLYSIRSERQLFEQLQYNLLFRRFVWLTLEDSAWDHSSFTKHRDRLIDFDLMRDLFGRVLEQARSEGLRSKEHFSVDGTLIRACASQRSFVPRKGPKPPHGGSRSNPEADFKGIRRTRETHVSSSDLDALLFTKSRKAGAIPAYMGHVLMENRSALAVDVRLTPAQGTAERQAALEMLEAKAGRVRITVRADKAYDHPA